jgi:MFS family permease
MDYAVVNGVLTLLGGVTSVAALPLWGWLSKEKGPRHVVLLSLLLAATHPLYYFVASPQRLWPMFADALSSGVAWSGFNLAIFNLVLLLAAGPRLGAHYAVYICVVGLFQAAGSLLGGEVVTALPDQVSLLGAVLERRQLMFATTSTLRLVTVFLLWRLVPARR